ncbi:class I SAM-dependent methyltransferase [Advenella kashmirensis]
MDAFSKPDLVANYAARTEKMVPGLSDLHKMAAVLLAERVPTDAHILVLGAGGGLEIKAFAQLHPDWHFDGVDPSEQMLVLARQTLGPFASRVNFHQSYIDSIEAESFDAATCFLTLHFLPEPERLKTLQALFRRLKPGAPLVVAHHSLPGSVSDKDLWLDRNAAFAKVSGLAMPSGGTRQSASRDLLPILSVAQDTALLRDAGFVDVDLFYAGFTFRGWVGYKPRT